MENNTGIRRGGWLAVGLFAVMAFHVPLFCHLLVLAGIVPYAAMVEMMILGFFEFGILGLVMVLNLLVNGAILWIFSRQLAGYLDRHAGRARRMRVVLVIAAVIAVGWLPVFGYSGHERDASSNAFSVYVKIFENFTGR